MPDLLRIDEGKHLNMDNVQQVDDRPYNLYRQGTTISRGKEDFDLEQPVQLVKADNLVTVHWINGENTEYIGYQGRCIRRWVRAHEVDTRPIQIGIQEEMARL